MNDDDRIYEALMAAGHRPNDIDGYEISHTGLLFHDEDVAGASMAVASYKARTRGETLTPAPATAHATKGKAIAEALARARAQRAG